MNDNQNKAQQTMQVVTSTTSKKISKRSSGSYNHLNAKIAETICSVYPELKTFWSEEADDAIDAILRDAGAVLSYAKQHPRFVENIVRSLI